MANTNLTEREKNMKWGVLETLKINSATKKEIHKVCKNILEGK